MKTDVARIKFNKNCDFEPIEVRLFGFNYQKDSSTITNI